MYYKYDSNLTIEEKLELFRKKGWVYDQRIDKLFTHIGNVIESKSRYVIMYYASTLHGNTDTIVRIIKDILIDYLKHFKKEDDELSRFITLGEDTYFCIFENFEELKKIELKSKEITDHEPIRSDLTG